LLYKIGYPFFVIKFPLFENNTNEGSE